MEIFFGWLIFSAIVGFIGSGRKIGFGLAFIASMFLSPIIGLIITLVSESDSSVAHKQQTKSLMEQQNEMIRKQGEMIKKMQDPNYVTEEEREEILREKMILEFEEKFKTGEISEEQYRNIYNNLKHGHPISKPKYDNTPAYIVVGIVIFLAIVLILMEL